MKSDRIPLLQVERLKKYFWKNNLFTIKKTEPQKAVEDVSFCIYKGKIMGLVGESGSGKSTTGRTILNLTPSTGGKVIFDSKTVFDIENNIKLDKAEMLALRESVL